MSKLKIYLLGPPRVFRDNTQISFDRRKAHALLAYLALTRGSHSRDVLAALLWPEAESSRAHASLNNHLWVLRNGGMSEWLQAGPQYVELRFDPRLWLDVAEFRARLQGSTAGGAGSATIDAHRLRLLTGAVEIYRERFLAGFGLRDSFSFDDWQMRQEEELRTELAGALERLVCHHRGRRRYDKAITYARRLTDLDPLNEPWQRLLAASHVDAGQRAAALSQLAKSERLLQEELGLAPARETIQLRNRIRSEGLQGIVGSGAGRESTGGDRKSHGNAGPGPNERTIQPHNLPAESSFFVGREIELALLRRLLADRRESLLSIVGPGGSGKTRLALQAARELAAAPAGRSTASSESSDRFRNGVYFVPLASVSNPEFLLPAILDTLGPSLTAPHLSPARNSLSGHGRAHAFALDFFREMRMLLVLDNLEHILSGIELLAQILACAPHVVFLTTSREPLHLARERVLRLDGLSVPEPGSNEDICRATDAVRLFLRTAERAKPGFAPDEAERTALARICRRLDGNPLGIGLAAGWTRMLSCAEIATEIDDSLDFLTTRRRDVPERHRSLRAVFDWSWSLLCEAERSCLRRVAVFHGGFSPEAARAVAKAPLATLAALVDRSLIRRDAAGRYEIHDLLLRYAAEKLQEDPVECADTRERFSRFYLDVLARMEKALKGSAQKGALDELALEAENLRTAWLWAAEGGLRPSMHAAAQSLFLFYDIRSRFTEGDRTFRESIDLLSRSESERDVLLLGVLQAARGWFLHFESAPLAQALLQQSLDALRPSGPGRELAFATLVAVLIDPQVRGAERRQKLSESLAMYEAAGDSWGVAMVLGILASACRQQDAVTALKYLRRSLRLYRESGDPWGISLTLEIQGDIAEEVGLLRVAQKRWSESLRMRRELGQDVAGTVGCLISLGRVGHSLGAYDDALRLYEESLRLSREIDSRWHTAQSLSAMGRIAYDRGEYERAGAHLEEALVLADAIGDGRQARRLAGLLSNVSLARGDREEACFRLAGTGHGPADEAGAGRAQAAGSGEMRSEAGFPGCEEAGELWEELAAGRLAARRAAPDLAARHFAAALRLAREDRDIPAALEILVDVARLSGHAASSASVELLTFVLAQAALSPPRRAQAESMMKGIGGAVPPSAPDAAGAGRSEPGFWEAVARYGIGSERSTAV